MKNSQRTLLSAAHNGLDFVGAACLLAPLVSGAAGAAAAWHGYIVTVGGHPSRWTDFAFFSALSLAAFSLSKFAALGTAEEKISSVT